MQSKEVQSNGGNSTPSNQYSKLVEGEQAHLESMDAAWQVIADRYDIHKILGQGTFGTVVSATHIETKTEVAIKLMKQTFRDQFNAKKIVSEIEIMRKLTSVKGNCFTTKIFDVILPEVDVSSDEPLEYLFIVMDQEDTDLYKVLDNHSLLDISTDHLVTIMYNMLCSVNYVHSANLVHRDLKPSNFLMNMDCIPKLCDFGLARSMPKSIVDYSNDVKMTNDDLDAEIYSLGTSTLTKSRVSSGSSASSHRKSSDSVSESADHLRLPDINEHRNVSIDVKNESRKYVSKANSWPLVDQNSKI